MTPSDAGDRAPGHATNAWAARATTDGAVTTLFATTAFAAAGLLFSVEPMMARMLLPDLGGSAAVWNTALVFFQTALLAGYAWAHVVLRRLALRRAMQVNLVALGAACLVLPIGIPRGWDAPGSGVTLWALSALAVAVGAPFVALSTLSPTLQHWLSTTTHARAHDPYFLYAAGNAGSLVALLAYPLGVEPMIGLRAQSRLWSGLYVGTIALALACAAAASVRRAHVRPLPGDGGARPSDPSGARRPLLEWVVVAALPSALLAGVTRHLATDVASVPLLWVLPLSVYLATFIAAFGRRSTWWTQVGTVAARPLATIALVDALVGLFAPLPGLVLHLAAFAGLAMAAHGRLAAARPAPAHLTRYYLLLSVGGVVGSATAVLVAPLAFDSILEYPLALLGAVALLHQHAGGFRWSPRSIGGSLLVLAGAAGISRWLGPTPGALVTLGLVSITASIVMRRRPILAVCLLGALTIALVRAERTGQVYAERTFFGVTRVHETGAFRELISGTTMHGRQSLADPEGRHPLAYYSPGSPVGDVLELTGRGRPLDVGVIGLGAGSLAAYGRTSDHFTFYEIDPAVVRVASNPELFGFLSFSRATTEVQLGDGRKLVESAPEGGHHLLVLDAFSSDAIPVHLLTREALAIYRASLHPDGVVAVHVSNRFFDLVPALGSLARDAGMHARVNRWQPPSDADGTAATTWVVLAPEGRVLDGLSRRSGWTEARPRGSVWTDDHADLLATLSLRGG